VPLVPTHAHSLCLAPPHPPRTQRAAEDSTEKRTKDTYGPPMGKRLIMFIDDLNMPRVDLYGTQQPIAFLKLFIERKGMYDRGKDLSWKNMKDMQVGGASSHICTWLARVSGASQRCCFAHASKPCCSRVLVHVWTQVIGAMGPPGGARNPVDPRFMSLFNVFEIQFPSSDNLSTIYQVRSPTCVVTYL